MTFSPVSHLPYLSITAGDFLGSEVSLVALLGFSDELSRQFCSYISLPVVFSDS